MRGWCPMLKFVDLEQRHCSVREWKKGTWGWDPRVGDNYLVHMRKITVTFARVERSRGGQLGGRWPRGPPSCCLVSLWTGGGGGPTGEGRGEGRERGRKGEEYSIRSDLSSSRRRGERSSRASPPPVARPSRGTRSPPLEWWNALPGTAAERTRKPYRTDIQTARWASPGQFDPGFVRPGKQRGTSRESP
jgi:hypothetical protein